MKKKISALVLVLLLFVAVGPLDAQGDPQVCQSLLAEADYQMRLYNYYNFWAQWLADDYWSEVANRYLISAGQLFNLYDQYCN